MSELIFKDGQESESNEGGKAIPDRAISVEFQVSNSVWLEFRV